MFATKDDDALFLPCARTYTIQTKMQGALFTTPLPLYLLASSDQSCSICLEPYIEPPLHGSTRRDEEGEWAVRIELVAGATAQRRCCRHVIGKQCLEAHLRSSGPWKRQCPLCRDVWFREPSYPTRASRHSLQSQALPRDERVTRSMALARGRTRRGRSRSLSHDRDEEQTSQPSAPHDGSNFTQRVREKLHVEDGSEQVGRTVEEVEQTLRDFYGQPANLDE